MPRAMSAACNAVGASHPLVGRAHLGRRGPPELLGRHRLEPVR